LRLLSHLSSTQEWDYSISKLLKCVFSDLEFTDLFEIQHADFEIFILRN